MAQSTCKAVKEAHRSAWRSPALHSKLEPPRPTSDGSWCHFCHANPTPRHLQLPLSPAILHCPPPPSLIFPPTSTKIKHSESKPNPNTQTEIIMSAAFQKAAEESKKLKTTPSNDELLELYGA